MEGLERQAALLKVAHEAAKLVWSAGKALEKDRAQKAVDEARAALLKFKKLLKESPDVEQLVSPLVAAAQEIEREAQQRLRRRWAQMAAEVAKELDSSPLRLEGQVPLLRAGPFAIEFLPTGKAVLYLGPKKYRLGVCPLESEKVAELLKNEYERLFQAVTKPEEFIRDLYTAYRVVLFKRGAGLGARVPIVEVLLEMALMRQRPGFKADPVREKYTSYGRVEFAVDLARLENTLVPGVGRVLRLHVATMSQTRRETDHLWVPVGGFVGTHYSDMDFVEAPQ